MNEFTKGPWLTRHLVDEDGDYDISSWDIHAFPYGKEAGQQGICYGITRLQDADLLALAPDMYEVIEELSNMDGLMQNLCMLNEPLQDKIYAILAKAKGESE